jgi:hypothetical protein
MLKNTYCDFKDKKGVEFHNTNYVLFVNQLDKKENRLYVYDFPNDRLKKSKEGVDMTLQVVYTYGLHAAYCVSTNVQTCVMGKDELIWNSTSSNTALTS